MNDNYATLRIQATGVPSGIIEISRSFLRSTFLYVSSLIDRNQDEKSLRCLYCHYVFDDQKNDFERLIIKLQSAGQFVDTDTCVKMLQGSKEIDRSYFHLSFDDGFRNNFTNAMPILKKHGVPAIFFVPSSMIEADWDKTKDYCLNIADYKAVIEMLRWSDLREMVSSGMEIGSHTRTHARFSSISGDIAWAEDEIMGSKQELEANIDFECKYISWPFGRLTDSDDKSLSVVRKAGYKACFGAFRGSIIPQKTDLFSIPRHHFEAQWPISHVMYFARGKMEMKI